MEELRLVVKKKKKTQIIVKPFIGLWPLKQGRSNILIYISFAVVTLLGNKC